LSHTSLIENEYQGENQDLIKMRHSAAHIMAESVLSLFPEAKLGIGPPIENGFYYDFDIQESITPEDLISIEAKMREIMESHSPFERAEISRKEALEKFSDQPYKLEIIESILDEKLSTYSHHGFTDLCQGPHVESTEKIGHFKLTRVAGAYWKSDESNPQLQRIYGVLFASSADLDEHLKRLEEAEKFDHRRIGRELDLFFFDPISPASPFFLPKGTTVYNLMTDFIRESYNHYGYEEVISPQIFSTELWKQSGHYENYATNMYFTNVDEREFGIKPMNCPGHCVIYKAQLHSYRNLPLRYADFGRLHRYERSGVTHGLTRVRSFSQDDAHIYCSPEQIEQEIMGLLEMMGTTYDAFGLSRPRFTLSLRPEKRVGSDEIWDKAENALRSALISSGEQFEEIENEGAFYGPKIDLFTRDALGRDWQLSTFQLDFNMPERFGLEYIGEDGNAHRPVMIHRAILGSLERFLGILIENNAGAFPVWLSPIQATIIPIADRHNEYAGDLAKKLKSEGLRVTVDNRSERMNAKIREGQLQKIPYMLIVGDNEQKNNSVSTRLRSNENLGEQSLEEFLNYCAPEIAPPVNLLTSQ
jgi:threonyl-tRNA synthetase|tara:strand:+ start:10338 stop:12104 length:1767 start_codon:yes stop_codon:yes gene_type:complete